MLMYTVVAIEIELFSSCNFTSKKLCNDSFSVLGYSRKTSAFSSQSTSSSDVKLFAFTAAELRAK